MARLFGTDGVRGKANELLTPELTMRLAQAASVVLGFDKITDGRRPVAVVAKDPRISGDFISAAIEAGLAASGVDVFDAGTLPTPAAAYLVADLNADFGVMISASHNPRLTMESSSWPVAARSSTTRSKTPSRRTWSLNHGVP